MPTSPEFQAARLARLRTKLNTYLPDTCTNSRTTASLAVLVEAEPKLLMLERGLRVREYEMTLPALDSNGNATDVQANDILTLASGPQAGLGFAVQQTLVPVSDYVSLRVYAVPTDLQIASYLAAENATFQHPTKAAWSVPAIVYVVDQIADVAEYGLTPAYRWMVVFESSLRYPQAPAGQGQIGDSHELCLASLFGTDGDGNARSGAITKPRPVLHALPFSAAFIKELPG